MASRSNPPGSPPSSPDITLAPVKRKLNFGRENAAIYPVCGDPRFLDDSFELPENEKKTLQEVVRRIKIDYPTVVIHFITTDELEMHNGYTRDAAREMGARLRQAYCDILNVTDLQEGKLQEGTDFVMHEWSEYQEPAKTQISLLKQKAQEHEKLRCLIDKISDKFVTGIMQANDINSDDKSDDNSTRNDLLQRSKEFIYEEYGVTLQWRINFGNLVIIQMLCSDERRKILTNWLGRNQHFPIEGSSSIQLLTYYDQNKHTFFHASKTKNRQELIPGFDRKVRNPDDIREFIASLMEKYEDFTPQIQKAVCEQISALGAILTALGIDGNPRSDNSESPKPS